MIPKLDPSAQLQLERLDPALRGLAAAFFPDERREAQLRQEAQAQAEQERQIRHRELTRAAGLAIAGHYGLDVRQAAEHILVQHGRQWTDQALEAVAKLLREAKKRSARSKR